MDSLDSLRSLRVSRDVVLTIGVFDGVHLGHQYLIGSVVTRARETDSLAAVLTFHPHPQLVLGPSVQPAYLTTLDERLKLIAGLGVDLTFTLQFSKELTLVSASDFVNAIHSAFRLSELRIGHDFALGHGRQGTVAVLRAMGIERGFTVKTVDAWQDSGGVISSTRIRRHIVAGEVSAATKLLGRPYAVSGRVVSGARRGRTLGFPTANVDTEPGILMPADGVYAVHALVGGAAYAAVCSIGCRPSFENAPRTFEVHLLDFSGDLYGQSITVRFAEYLRGEQRFPSVQELVDQIRADVALTRGIFRRTTSVDACTSNT
jgi:riboflavin kinase/FMN adenylyltransferase